MSKILQFILTIGLGGVAQLYFPFWSVVLVAFIIGLFFLHKNSRTGFFIGFLAIAILWGGYAFYLDMLNESILSTKMGNLFGGLPGLALVCLTGVLGGLLGGMGALTANLGRKLFV